MGLRSRFRRRYSENWKSRALKDAAILGATIGGTYMLYNAIKKMKNAAPVTSGDPSPTTTGADPADNAISGPSFGRRRRKSRKSKKSKSRRKSRKQTKSFGRRRRKSKKSKSRRKSRKQTKSFGKRRRKGRKGSCKKC